MKKSPPEKVRHKLENLPDKPGCYLMRNADDTVIYVGKAVVLRNRVRSYFHASAQQHPKTAALVDEIADITWWVTKTELEALMLENELIKRYQPHYNIRLKDDRNFPYIKVNWQDDFPKIEVVRNIRKDNARYFGPYTSSTACYQTLDALRRIFPYLDCDRTITGQDARPCLYYHIKMCGGPCIGKQSRTEYRATVAQLMHFLEGGADAVLNQLEGQMERAAENLQFELAALYRDRLKAAQRIAQQQKVINASMEDADYVAVAQEPALGDTAVQVFKVRNGRLIGRENFMLEGADVPDADVNVQGVLIGSFIQRFYDSATFVPRLILVQAMPDDATVLEEWLTTRRGSRVELRVPQRGAKRDLMALAGANADEYLRVQMATRAADTNRQTEALQQLQDALDLPRPPARIECYDISTLQGTNTVGSMVVFAKGVPLKSAYKRFKIRGKGSQGEPDDFASMREMLRRRFRRVVEELGEDDPSRRARKGDESWRVLPDLVIIDGGKGQLGIAVEVLDEFNLRERIPVVGLAKREEEVFLPGRRDPAWLKRGSDALYLVQRIRDEAHRFAITYHRKLRRKEQTRSKLDDIQGIGPKRRKALLTYYSGDLDRIRTATVDELAAVPGMTRRSAEAVKEQL
ncbi:MAG: excinuclease ABC subunit UvrC [Caldilineaceae bacterium]|nr:excinuclease ABC subunit UvrC [Caldilineaceae bacterium]